MASYRQLEVWKWSVDMTAEIYAMTKGFPKEETYGLVSQMRRAAISIPSNIAEGSGRGSRKDYTHFLAIAHGSCCELETQCVLGHKLGYISADVSKKMESRIASTGRMLKALIKALKATPKNQP
jgi:four helix bundle protein